MTTKEKVLKAVREAKGNEELMRLSFGCQIIIEGCTEPTRFVCEELRKSGRVWVISGDDENYGVCPKPGYVRVIGHQPQLQHWLRLLGEGEYYFDQEDLYPRIGFWKADKKDKDCVLFNLTTGQPASDKDYDALAELLGIE